MSFFKPEDFIEHYRGHGIAEKANRLLQERRVRVTGTTNEVKMGAIAPVRTSWHSPFENKDDTHQALLVCIEELPKKECEHEGFVDAKGALHINWPPYCLKCGVKLKAKWEVAE